MRRILGQPDFGEAVAVHCQACGQRFRARSWRAGIVCPKCESGQVEPLVVPGGAVDYCVADRSKGYAPADVRFAQWAKWCGVITPHQYEVAFLKQNRQIQEGEDPAPVHEILIREGALTEKQTVRLLEFLCLPHPDEDDGRFVETLLATTRVDPEKVRQTRALQLKAATRYHEVPPLCQLLMERHVLSEAQMLAVLRLQQQNGYGALKLAHDVVVRPALGTRWAALRAALSPANPHVRMAAIVVTLFALAVGLWLRQLGNGLPLIYVRCSNCNHIADVPWSKTFPVTCPRCLREEAYYLKICRNGHMFTVQSPYVPEPCPQCGSPSSRAVKSEDFR